MIQTKFEVGPNQAQLSMISTNPIIAIAEDTYEVGRVLRCLAVFLDQYKLSPDKIAEAVEIVVRGAAAHKGYNSKFAAKDLAHHFITLFRLYGVTERELELQLRAYAQKRPEFALL